MLEAVSEARASRKATAHAGQRPAVSPWLRRWFGWYVRKYLARHFAAVRITVGGAPKLPLDRPAVVYLNHPSWWDPLTAAVLALTYYPERTHFAPIEAAALQKYRFFEKLGFFGVDAATPSGRREFLTTSKAILARPESMLWITPQGEFTDPRDRPVRLRPGVAHLARRAPSAVFVPLAVEYPFWNSPRPEALAHFGDPLLSDARHSPSEWQWQLAEALETAQDRLARGSRSRDPAQFRVLVQGRGTMSGVYRYWQKLTRRSGH